MVDVSQRPRMRVEGTDDLHSLVHLLLRHGIDYETEPWPSYLPRFEACGGVDELLEVVTVEIPHSAGRPIGFVLDADSPLSSRWQSVRDRLTQLGLEPPATIPTDGLILDAPTYKTTVGVWLMPDNQRDGKIEDFLRDLVNEQDPLIAFAETCANSAKQDHGAPFRDVDAPEATLHTWLAWQESPGLPYGSAMKAHYFRHDSPAALTFVAWFKRLYGIT